MKNSSKEKNRSSLK